MRCTLHEAPFVKYKNPIRANDSQDSMQNEEKDYLTRRRSNATWICHSVIDSTAVAALSRKKIVTFFLEPPVQL